MQNKANFRRPKNIYNISINNELQRTMSHELLFKTKPIQTQSNPISKGTLAQSPGLLTEGRQVSR